MLLRMQDIFRYPAKKYSTTCRSELVRDAAAYMGLTAPDPRKYLRKDSHKGDHLEIFSNRGYFLGQR